MKEEDKQYLSQVGMYLADLFYNQNNMKQTAVEWLASNLDIVWEEKTIDLVEQAKAMEKQQIIDAWNDGYREFYDGSSTPEEYYNQTFKSE